VEGGWTDCSLHEVSRHRRTRIEPILRLQRRGPGQDAQRQDQQSQHQTQRTENRRTGAISHRQSGPLAQKIASKINTTDRFCAIRKISKSATLGKIGYCPSAKGLLEQPA
jgi:hypothetical protein